MNRTQGNPEEILDGLIADVRDEQVADQVVEDAGRRVWERLSAGAAKSGRLASCEDFQALIPTYHDGTLAPSRRMLFEDHMHGCVPCRKRTFGEVAPPPAVVEMPVRRMTRGRWMAIAASVAVAALVGQWQLAEDPQGPQATVRMTDGNVYRLANGMLQPVKVGDAFSDQELLRTAAGAKALVVLQDGSIVEAGERSELRVSARRGDTTIHLSRGPIIVQAAKRRSGRLYVANGDSRVMVTGTVFSVNRGAKGTRVSVMEGEVIVEHGRDDKVLRAGDQLATHSSMEAVPIREEISWSRDAETHLRTLREMVAIKQSVENARMPGMRYQSRLMDAIPANAVVFLSIPNLRDSLRDAQRLFAAEMRRNGADSSGARISDFMERIGAFSEYLGEEMVVAGLQSGKDLTAVAIAEAHRPGLGDFLRAEAAKAGGAKIQIVEGDAPIQPRQKDELLILIRDNRLVLGIDEDLVKAAIANGGGFPATPFGQRISQSFQEGAGIILGVDLQRIVTAETKQDGQAVANRLGVDGIRYLVAGQKTFGRHMQHSAVLNFDGPRHGLASWLGAPGPMGGLSFVSPRAQFAASVITKDPRQMIEELFALAGASGSNGVAELEEFQRSTGVDLRRDIAAALGSEATVAIDGPMLPTPSLKVIVEVNQPEQLQQSLERMVAAIDAELQKQGKPGLTLEKQAGSEESQAPTYRLHLKEQQNLPEIYYTYRDGYLVAAATKAMLTEALERRANGRSLDRSDGFRRLLPTDQHANFSAILYQNARETLKFLSNLAPEQQAEVRELAEKTGPTLIGAYAEADRIQVATYGSSMDLLMQTALAPMFHGRKPGAQQKRGTTKAVIAYRR